MPGCEGHRWHCIWKGFRPRIKTPVPGIRIRIGGRSQYNIGLHFVLFVVGLPQFREGGQSFSFGGNPPLAPRWLRACVFVCVFPRVAVDAATEQIVVVITSSILVLLRLFFCVFFRLVLSVFLHLDADAASDQHTFDAGLNSRSRLFHAQLLRKPNTVIVILTTSV